MMRDLALLGILIGGCAVSTASAQSPSKPIDKAALRIKAIEFERQLNLKAYIKYRSKREWMATKFPGRWVIIAGGKLLPIRRNPNNRFRKLFFEPSKTLAEAIAAVAKTVPDARHRFVFRVGEDGDHKFKMGMTSQTHVLGFGFYMLLPGEECIVSGRELFTTGKGGGLRVKMAKIAQIEARLFAPGTDKAAKPLDETFLLATVYGGSGTVSRATAEKLHLELWEIPGKVDVRGLTQAGVLRRGRVLLGFKGAELRLHVPVAIWDR